MSTITQTRTLAIRRTRAGRILMWAAIAVVLLLVSAYLTIGAVIANNLTVPVRNFALDKTPATLALAYQDVRFPARGGDVEIAGWYIPAEGSRRAVILVHGKDGSRTTEFNGQFIHLAKAFHERNFAVLMIDLRGHGQSGEGRFGFGLNERRDVEGAVDWLKGQGFQAGSMGVLGVSLGAASSIGAAADEPDIGALVEDSGYAAIYPIIKQQWNNVTGLPDFLLPAGLLMHRVLFGFDIGESSPVDEIGRIAPRPVLIIHGSADSLVPVSHAEQLKAAAPSAEIWIVPGVEHAGAYNADPETYTEKVIGFFNRHLK